MRRYQYEICLGDSYVSPMEWQEFLVAAQRQIGGLRSWSIQLQFEHHILHYYLSSPSPLPPSLQLPKFLLKPATSVEPESGFGWPLTHRWDDNCVKLALHLEHRHLTLQTLLIELCGWRRGLLGRSYTIVTRDAQSWRRQLLLSSPATLLSVDFNQSKSFGFKKIPKYLNLDKVIKILQPPTEHDILEADPFPFAQERLFLQLAQYDFSKHSLILGGSGMGKSKFIASLIHRLHSVHPGQYQIVVIDPHDALKADLVHIPDRTIVDFVAPESSINLFATRAQSLSASIELMLGLFQSLIADNYNSRLERILRYSIYLLSTAGEFTFATLRQLLTDLEYRQELLSQWQSRLPESVVQFFLTDFQELKTKSYSEAIAPIIAFLDEMQMVPTFNQKSLTPGLEGILQDRFLTIFSLNRLQFGDKVVRTLAGLLMQQLFLLAQSRSPDKQLLVIIDEVAVVENLILPRFLSELRKYGVSVFLAGQYFAQISPELRHSIFANVSNYYLFRVSRTDANLLVPNLEMKLIGSDTAEDSAQLISGLGSRECLVQISHQGKILPAFKARTLDYAVSEYVPPRAIPIIPELATSEENDNETEFDFALDDADIGDILQNLSTSRKKL